MPSDPSADRAIAQVFAATFASARVRLCGGFTEPQYVPPGDAPGELRYTLDYAASALHEAAHWCLAGAARRTQPDFGYEYVPATRRTFAEQLAFEAAEVRTQAVEWRLALAAGVPFRVSIDCFGRDRAPFRDAVYAEVLRRLQVGWPVRAERFARALAVAFDGVAAPAQDDFTGGLADA